MNSFAKYALLHVHLTAWMGVLVLLAFYSSAIAVLHWKARRGPVMIQYKPALGISPAIAAYLWESGRGERAFAAALVSLAARGCIRIEQQKDWSFLQKASEPASDVPPEEVGLLMSLFPTSDSYTFNGADCDLLSQAYTRFQTTVDGIADPALISGHTLLWALAVVFSVEVPVFAALTFPDFVVGTSVLWWLMFGVWIVLGGSCLVAAFHVWPATLSKLGSFLRFGPPHRRLNLNDAAPLFLTATALMCFVFLGSGTCAQFALLIATLVIIHALARYALESPTGAGGKVLAELGGFREFLLRVEADRLNRENQPGLTPQTLD